MGLEIEQDWFTEDQRVEFLKKLRDETSLLKKWFNERKFEFSDQSMMGLEIEACLLDRNHLPLPKNSEFLSLANDPSLVTELSKFNFELNVDPSTIGTDCFSKMEQSVRETWNYCRETAGKIGSRVMLIGILPTVREEMLQPEYMSDSNRYRALNSQVLYLREGKPLQIDIFGVDELHLVQEHLMLEAATTSIQVHLQVNQENAKRVFNASLIVSAPIIAVSANSPFLYGKRLWDESRIPVFEQAVQVASFRDRKGKNIGRVTFGTGYIKHSLMELFLENLNGYPCLLPINFSSDVHSLEHLKLQNGTIWRWNRPIVGISDKKKPHLRIEQRTMASGPSISDVIANTAFYIGLAKYYSETTDPLEESMTFTDCRNSFYAAAKSGLRARVRWLGKEIEIQKLILDELIPNAVKGLERLGVGSDETDYYLLNIIRSRVISGQNGASWQDAFVNCYGKDFQAMSGKYLENQETEKPVHQWKV